MTDPGWTGWQDANGDMMFVADGPKRQPRLVRTTRDGEHEMVLAVFADEAAALVFQEWIDASFEATALANQRLSLQPPTTMDWPSAQQRPASRIPGVGDD